MHLASGPGHRICNPSEACHRIRRRGGLEGSKVNQAERQHQLCVCVAYATEDNGSRNEKVTKDTASNQDLSVIKEPDPNGNLSPVHNE